MPAMRFPRPKSLSGLMLIGFTIVAAPLLFAIVNAAVQMNQPVDPQRAAGGSRRAGALATINACSRRSARSSAPRACIRSSAVRTCSRSMRAISSAWSALSMSCSALPLDAESRDDALALQAEAERLHLELTRSTPNSTRMTDLINAFPQLSDLASKVSNRVSAQIDRELSRPAARDAAARSEICFGRRCCWCP